jgi:hypothetical protein
LYFGVAEEAEIGRVNERSTSELRNGTTVHDITTSTTRNMAPTSTAQRCARCGFHPASPRIGGYCSWDCYEADDDEEGDADGEQAA